VKRRREAVDVYRLDRAAYHLLAEDGAFDDTRVELVNGLIVRRSDLRRSRKRADAHSMLPALRDAPFEVHRIDRDGSYQLADAGAFAGKKVELIDGVLVAMNAMRGPHASSMMRLNRLLTAQLDDRVWVRAGLPLAVSRHSEPEPDFALVSDEAMSAAEEHPSTANLVIEVADASHEYDLGLKALLYAAAIIPEYWVVDLQTHKLVVHLEPKKGKYQRVHRFGTSREVTSTVTPKVTLKVAAVF
jgi:Uma2 family endonuclease